MSERTDSSSDGNADGLPRHRNRFRYALREFLLVPLITVGVWIVLAVTAIVLDRTLSTPASAVAKIVPPEATSTLLETMTPGLVTVVSIIFFVLLMAVQHQSSTYSPVVLDQFLRRKSNQLFFGIFVGLTVYSLLILALIPPGQAVISGTLALALATITFISLLLFVYSTVDQMRPSSTVAMLRHLALQARASQQPLLIRCRAESQYTEAPTTQVTSQQAGYITHIDAELLARALQPVSDTVEIELHVEMGDYVGPGTTLADIRGDASTQRESLARTVLDALRLGRTRDIERDPARTVDQLSNMAWSATATAGDPDGARVAVAALYTLLLEIQEQDIRHMPDAAADRSLPLVYHDEVRSKILDGLTSVITASVQSGQHQTCSDALTVLSKTLPLLEPATQRVTIDRLQRVLPSIQRHVFTADMEVGFEAMRQAMHNTELTDSAQRVNEIMDQLHEEHRLDAPAAAAMPDQDRRGDG